MRNPDNFEISAFDRHPAFRLKRTFRKRTMPAAIHKIAPRNANVWPLPSIGGLAPRIIDKYEDGVSLSYESAGSTPRFVPVYAASDGVVKHAGTLRKTSSLVLDHGDGHRSYYCGIDHSFVLPTGRHPSEQTVNAGDVLGYLDRTRAESCLLFNVSKLAGHWHYEPVDMNQVLGGWRVLPLNDERPTPTESTLRVAA